METHRFRSGLNHVYDGGGIAGLPMNNNQPLDIGRYYWSGDYSKYFDGKIIDFKVYDYALTDEEILGLAN